MKFLVKHSFGAYGNLRKCASSVSSFKYFSSHDSPPKMAFHIEVISSGSSFVWPETKLGVLEPKDSRFPFPGLVGSNMLRKDSLKKKVNHEIDLLTEEQNHERQSSILEQFLAMNNNVKPLNRFEFTDSLENFQFTIEECPYFLKKDLHEMFPNAGLLQKRLSIINIYLKDEKETSDSSEQFDQVASDICKSLCEVGFWADFIDSKSGKPHLGHGLSGADSYEIEKRYRSLAAKLQVYLGCTIIDHKHDKKYMGCLTTTAPVHHPLLLALTDLLEK